ncbi:MAG: hypothetical protein J0H67_00185 [Rhodospirillales bacterium]|nr:hypothetical protein [Rhodospirillales bacterium]
MSDAPETPPHPVGRTVSAAQFWELMERWNVPDPVALELIAFPGKMPRSGKRPRFRFITKQQRLAAFLAEVDRALAAAGHQPAWLHQKRRAAPFNGRSPLQVMVEEGLAGSATVLRVLTRAALERALKAPYDA